MGLQPEQGIKRGRTLVARAAMVVVAAETDQAQEAEEASSAVAVAAGVLATMGAR
jgi:hypothetical protein